MTGICRTIFPSGFILQSAESATRRLARLLKRPAILLAAISKTDYAHYHAQYLQLKQQIPAHTLPDSDCLNRLCMFATKNVCELKFVVAEYA